LRSVDLYARMADAAGTKGHLAAEEEEKYKSEQAQCRCIL